jgi:outer membrane protein assembly factor BamB
VDLRSGEADEKIDVATYVASSAAILGDLAYLGDHDGRFSSIDLKEGSIRWTWANEKASLPFLASPSVTPEYVIIGNEDRNVYCLDRRTGELIWKFNTGSRVNASVVVAGRDVLTANMRGDLHILDIEDGTPRWTYELGSMVIGNPAVSGGKFYVAASDGYLYGFGK